MRSLLLLASLVLLPLAGCNGGGGGLQGQAVDYTAFVTGLLATTADDIDPAPINDLPFVLPIPEDPAAFDGVLR
ncbi:MAG: hypothetical protein ACT4PV_12845 [Planctomycetaceae bacterium]